MQIAFCNLMSEVLLEYFDEFHIVHLVLKDLGRAYGSSGDGLEEVARPSLACEAQEMRVCLQRHQFVGHLVRCSQLLMDPKKLEVIE